MWRLTADQLATLYAFIDSAYATIAELGTMLGLRLARQLDSLASPTSLKPAVIYAVLLRANADGWLAEFVEALKQDRPGRPDIQAFNLPPMIQPAGGGDPYEDHIVRGQRVLLNRIDLRKAVRNLEAGAAYRFLVVTGGDKTGKTYSRQFITHVCEVRKTFTLGWINLVDLYQQEEGPLTPEPIAQRLFAYLKLDPSLVPPKDDEKYERWSQRTCNELIRLLPPNQPGAAALPNWLILDGFNSVPLHDGTTAFVEELSRHVEATLTGLRLVLLGYKTTLPEDVEALTLRESLAVLSDRDLTDFFERVHRQRELTLSEEDLAKKVADSVANVRRSIQAGDSVANNILGGAVAKEWAGLSS